MGHVETIRLGMVLVSEQSAGVTAQASTGMIIFAGASDHSKVTQLNAFESAILPWDSGSGVLADRSVEEAGKTAEANAEGGRVSRMHSLRKPITYQGL